ncbi:MAG TPA: hypothetical protein VMZ32_18255, partial [Gammaproteobacteria bacterium]|nr:hypothetical protein [Gammaproteobacteria bacterium]
GQELDDHILHRKYRHRDNDQDDALPVFLHRFELSILEALHFYGRNAGAPEPGTRNASKRVTFIVAHRRRRSLAKRKGSIESAGRIAAHEKSLAALAATASVGIRSLPSGRPVQFCRPIDC